LRALVAAESSADRAWPRVVQLRRNGPGRRGQYGAMRRSPRDRLPAESWLRSLYDEHVDVVFRYAASRCGRDAAHDITAETFAEAIRTGDRFDERRGSARAWLLGIATNQIGRHRRVEARYLRTVPYDPVAADQQLMDIPSRVDAARVGPAIRSAVAELPEGERAALLLHVIADLSYREVAEALSLTQTAVRVRMHRARTRLEKSLAPLILEETPR
jgi:RNA polymerase sigma factor (sigma-70 family)